MNNAPKSFENTRKLHEGCARKIITGLELAGGCTVRVSMSAAIVVPNAKSIAHQTGPNNHKNDKPISEARTCLSTMLHGYEKGDSGKPKARSELAPNDPIISGIPAVCVIKPSAAINHSSTQSRKRNRPPRCIWWSVRIVTTQFFNFFFMLYFLM
jgi:hypothetical protein